MTDVTKIGGREVASRMRQHSAALYELLVKYVGPGDASDICDAMDRDALYIERMADRIGDVTASIDSEQSGK